MPSAAARRMYEDQIPPFMTVFDLDADVMTDRETVTLVDPKMADAEHKASTYVGLSEPATLGDANGHPDQTHKHHDSTSTQMSESTDSSPTTTLSTTDSSPLSDPSPSSSPDSPINLIPLNNYPSTTFDVHPQTSTAVVAVATTNCKDSISRAPHVIQPLHRPMTSPGPRRPRNMKGLSIQPPLTITTTSKYIATEPSSPSFIKPAIPGMKRKPSQLSLKTNASDLLYKSSVEVPASPSINLAIPPILQRRALKHSTSSPHMLEAAMRSSTYGPPSGMTLPRVFERNESGLSQVLRPMPSKGSLNVEESIAEEGSPIRTQMANRGDFEPYEESMNNEDQKSPGYPDGPIAIYGDNVYLYLEPTAEEASRFDVVINVAREVANPFDMANKTQSPSPPAPATESPIPNTAVSTASFTTAFEFPPQDDSSVETPTTPKANPLHMPEYIHIPWDHNTDIAPDLIRLCEVIEDRTNKGKKVLVHCQQGASRSASLIIAYGLYQSPELSVNDAYYAAQGKSRWISPNMKLMYSLQDFHKELAPRRLPPSSSHRSRNGRSPSKHRPTQSADAADSTLQQPQSAPLPNGGSSSGGLEADGQNGTESASPQPVVISAGPASAPLSYSWKEAVAGAECEPSPFPASSLPPKQLLVIDRELPADVNPGFGLVDPISSGPEVSCAETVTLCAVAPAVASLPLRVIDPPAFRLDPDGDVAMGQVVSLETGYPDDSALLSPRAEEMTTNPLHSSPDVAGMRFAESPPTPTQGLFSPREVSFPQDAFPFFGNSIGFGRPTQAADPRSPPTKGEAPIVRSIDEYL